MIYFHVQVAVKPGTREEFHKFWIDEALPIWEKYGAKHIGSFNCFIGEIKGDVSFIRLFAFENMDAVEKFLLHLRTTDEGLNLRAKLSQYVVESHNQLLVGAYGSPLQ